nr:subunit 4L of NADH-plastoquinone oxidoreductase [Roya anglica]AHZ11149.1 subunit 4L of NADH-plastoquinone oxidoreductase [Roya anglica]
MFEHSLCLGAYLFCLGIYGLITSRNMIRALMSLELMLNGVNINLITFSSFLDSEEIKGQVFAIFIIAIAAAEAAIGLAIVLNIYRNRNSIRIDQFDLLKW